MLVTRYWLEWNVFAYHTDRKVNGRRFKEEKNEREIEEKCHLREGKEKEIHPLGVLMIIGRKIIEWLIFIYLFRH